MSRTVERGSLRIVSLRNSFLATLEPSCIGPQALFSSFRFQWTCPRARHSSRLAHPWLSSPIPALMRTRCRSISLHWAGGQFELPWHAVGIWHTGAGTAGVLGSVFMATRPKSQSTPGLASRRHHRLSPRHVVSSNPQGRTISPPGPGGCVGIDVRSRALMYFAALTQPAHQYGSRGQH